MMETVAASADLAAATVFAMRGDQDQVATAPGQRARRRRPGRVPRRSPPATQHAAGLAALAEGSYAAAYGRLSQLFDG